MTESSISKAKVLIVDDEEPIRILLKARFEREGITVLTAENAQQAIQAIADTDITVMITDVKMPGKNGIELLEEVRKKKGAPKVIVMTGHGEKSTAIDSLRKGASDYIEKPFDMDEMTHSLKRTLNEFRLERENEDFVHRLEARVARVEGKTEDQFWYVSKSKSMEQVNEWLKVLQRESLRGSAEEPVTLIIGESGTGKEGIARMVHAGSRRAKGPWIALNCANFNEQLLESELFGHERGSFTGATTQKRGLFELAKGGTLFLDEIGEMDAKLQARLLRVLQEKTFRRVGGTIDLTADVRVVAATNQNLGSFIAQGKFREDLYHRLSRVVINIPPLRMRTEDVLPMSIDFFTRSFLHRGKKFEGLHSDAESLLANYPWPGNVRELLNVVERTALLWNKSGKVRSDDVPLASKTPQYHIQVTAPSDTPLAMGTDGFNTESIQTGLNYTHLKKRWSEAFEKEYLVNILNRHQGNVSAAAKESGIDRSNFLRLLRRHQLNAQNFREMKKAA